MRKIAIEITNKKNNENYYVFGYTDMLASRDTNVFYSSIVINSIDAAKISNVFRQFITITMKVRNEYVCFNKYNSDLETYKGRDGWSHIIIRRKTNMKEAKTCQISAPIFLKTNQEEHPLEWYNENDNIFFNTIAKEIFNIIYQNTTIPVLEEWGLYITKELIKKQRLKYASLLFEHSENNHEMLRDYGFKSIIATDFTEHDIISFIEEGLKTKQISIDGCNSESEAVKNVTGMDDYQLKFGQQLAAKTKSNFHAKFDPTHDCITPHVDDFFNVCMYYAPRIQKYAIQENVVQAAVNQLNANKNVLISGQPGCGKTLLGIASVTAHARKNNFSVCVMVPPNMLKNWANAIQEVSPFSEVYTVTDINSLIKVKNRIQDKGRMRSIWAIMSNNTAKVTYEEHPSVVWSESKQAYLCPDCGKTIYTRHVRQANGEPIYRYDNGFRKSCDIDFLSPNEYNTTCNTVGKLKLNEGEKISMAWRDHYEIGCGCKAKLWTAATRDNNSEWVKLNGIGWVNKKRIPAIKEYVQYNLDHLYERAPKTFKQYYMKIIAAITEYESRGDTTFYPKRVSIAHYISKHMKNVFDYGIFDEVHELAGNSQQGEAFGNITNSCWKSIFLTGTVSNGYASGLFYLLFRTQTKRMLDDGFNHDSVKDFIERYGVKERTEEAEGYFFNEDDHSPENLHVTKRRSKGEKEKPGISPTLFVDYLMDNTVFILKKDIKKNLCKYTEYPVGIKMDEEQIIANDAILGTVSDTIQTNNNSRTATSNRTIRNAVLKATMFLDQPYGIDTMMEDGSIIELPAETIRPKEQELIKICTKHVERGEKILVYCEYTNRLSIIDRLTKLLKDSGLKASGLSNNVKQNERQAWLTEKAQNNELDVVILNPALVGTGLNLLDYTTIIFYEIGTKLTTIRQASQRSNRINQEKPVSVYFMYYQDTVQEDQMALISQKLKASKAIEGDFSESAIQAMSEDTDIMTKLAAAIVNNQHIKVDANNFDMGDSINDEEEREQDIYIMNNSNIKKHSCFADRPKFYFDEPENKVDFLSIA